MGGNALTANKVRTVKRVSFSDDTIVVTPVVLNFDYFLFPSHCANSTLGALAQDGYNALDLLNCFEITVHGIERCDGEVVWFPSASERVYDGDYGLIARAPCSVAEDAERVASPDNIWTLEDLDCFRKLRGLQGEEAWNLWQQNMLRP